MVPTVPATGDGTLISIFIASTTRRSWSFATVSPGFTKNLTIVPFIGARTFVPAPEADGAGKGKMAVWLPIDLSGYQVYNH